MIMIVAHATVVNINVEAAVMEAANHVPLSRIITRVTMMLAARGQVEEVVGVDLITKYGRRVPHIVFELTGEEDEEKRRILVARYLIWIQCI